MKVLHINQHLAWAGGVETYVLSLLPQLEKRGVRSAFAYAEGDPGLASETYQVSPVSRGDRRANAEAYEEMGRVLDRARPDLVHLHQIYNTGAIQACLERVPVLVHAHDFRYVCPASTFYYKRTREVCHRVAGPGCFTTTLSKRCLTHRPANALAYYRRVQWMVKQRARFAGVVAPSAAARERYLAAGFAPDRVQVNPYFCPLPPLDQPRRLPETPTIVFAGRISPNKGADVFIEALARLPETVQGWMIGNFTAESQAAVEQQGRALGCADRLQLSGWLDRSRIREAYERATVFVFPSVWMETLGIVGIEALATGTPVVASDIGGVREWLIPGETGFLAPPKSASDFARHLERLIADPELNRTMGENGLALVRERFSAEAHLERLMALYASAYDQKPRKSPRKHREPAF